jgi:hypothetical protein
MFASRAKSASANQLAGAGNRIYRLVTRTQCEIRCASLAAVLRLAMRLPAMEYVAPLAMLRSRAAASLRWDTATRFYFSSSLYTISVFAFAALN